jgi:hypothetical protein
MPTEGASAWRGRSAPARPLVRPRTGAPARPAGSLPVVEAKVVSPSGLPVRHRRRDARRALGGTGAGVF